MKMQHSKGVLITGGSSGLGLALARVFLQAGHRVVITGRRQHNLQKNENHLKRELPTLIEDSSRLHSIVSDVSEKNSIYPSMLEVNNILGRVDILINNASALGKTPLRDLIDTDCEDLEQVLQTNLLGPFRLIKAFLPGMLLAGKGLVVNISSDAAISAYEGWGGYSVSKAALDHLSRIFQQEISSQGVRFVSLDPGDMATPMQFAAIPERDPKELYDPNFVAMQMLNFLESDALEKTKKVRFSASEWRQGL